MMKISSILVGGFIMSMLLLFGVMFFVGDTNSLERSKIKDAIVSTDHVGINLNLNNDVPYIKESVHSKLNNTNYWIDDDGRKHYIINAYDSPNIQE